MLASACRKTKGILASNEPVTQLPLEVWARIFSHLKAENVLASAVSEQAVAKLMADQAYFHQLKLVCSKFRDVFAEHPELSDEISVNKSSAHTFIPSILVWIQRWRSSIQRVNWFSRKEHQEMLLGALACPDSLLDMVYLTNASQNAVHALPVFSSLSQCEFHDQQVQLDLTALHALPSLKELTLSSGCYSSVPATGHLTTLWVMNGTVLFSGASLQDISLETLVIISSKLSGLHDIGLAACTALSCLECRSCVFSAELDGDVLQLSEDVTALIPARMSELTCLTKLEMGIEPGSDMPLDISWVYSLFALRHLELDIEGEFLVSRHWTQLTGLTCLKLSNTAASDNELQCASFNIDWQAMQALRHLEIDGPVSFNACILQLTTLQGLSFLHLSDIQACAEDDTASYLARLMYQLAARCPWVRVYVDETPIDSAC